MVGTGICTVVAGETNDRTKGRAIRDPADVLGEDSNRKGGFDLSVKTSNTACTRSIKGSDISDISSRSPDGSDRVKRSSMGTNTSRILYSPSRVETTQGEGESLRIHHHLYHCLYKMRNSKHSGVSDATIVRLYVYSRGVIGGLRTDGRTETLSLFLPLFSGTLTIFWTPSPSLVGSTAC